MPARLGADLVPAGVELRCTYWHSDWHRAWDRALAQPDWWICRAVSGGALREPVLAGLAYLSMLLATFLPARQASRIHPAEALRFE